MPPEHLIVCGPPGTAGGRRSARRANAVRLDTTPRTGNVNLRLQDIAVKMVTDLPPVAEDLIELAAYVYAADQASERGDLTRFDYGLAWRRRFRFEVPVRCPDVWRDPRVSGELVRTLSFLSDDAYEFEFTHLKRPTRLPEYLDYTGRVQAATDVDSLMLFSGGLDSLAGAIDEALVRGRKVVLVSHRPVSKIESRQNGLVEALVPLAGAGRTPFHVPVLVNKKKWLGRDFTQRTRSFLFLAFAAVVARLFGLDRVRFYENGIVSCNLPISAQVLGGRASRTTHPRVLNGFERLLQLLFDRPFVVENPFFWKTRTDVVEGVRAAGQAALVARSVSCAHTWRASTEQPHCGTCSQCVDRRLAVIAAGLTDAEDPAGRYRVDLLTGHLGDVLDQTMVERIVGTAREVKQIGGPLQFVQRFGEASRLLNQLPGRPEEVAVELFKMHRRHAGQVTDAIDREFAERVRRRQLGGLPPTCLLRMAGGASAGQAAQPFGAPGVAPAAASCSHVPTKEDWAILQALGGAAHTLLQEDLRQRLTPRLSRRTLGTRLAVLVRVGLVRYPNGARKGVALAGAGRALAPVPPEPHRGPARAH